MESWLSRLLAALPAPARGAARSSPCQRRRTRLVWSAVGISLLVGALAFGLSTFGRSGGPDAVPRAPALAADEHPPAAGPTLAAVDPAPPR